MQHGELRSDRGSWLVIEFFIQFSFFNINDTFKTGEALFYIFFKLVFFTNDSMELILLQCLSNSNVEEMIERRDPLFADSGRAPLSSEIPEWLQEFRENLVDERVPELRDSHASSSHEISSEPTSKRSEDLGKHSVYTHFPRDRNCEICKRTKITRAPCRRRNGEAVPRPEKIWWLDNSRPQGPKRQLRVSKQSSIRSRGTGSSYSMDPGVSVQNKTSQETQRSLQKFLEPERNPKVIYTDNSMESGKACEDLSWDHCTSTPHRSETNGIAERAVRRVKEGTSAVLLQSGLNESWWADSMECYTYLRNVTDLLSDGKTPYERRFGKPFGGPVIPFGSLVEYHPVTAKDQSRIHQFGKKVLPGLFLGYALYAVRIWKGDVLVADLEELETMDASEIYSKRLNAKEVIFPRRRSGTENIHLDTAASKSRRRSRRLSWRIRRVFSANSWLTSGCRWSNERLLVHVGKLAMQTGTVSRLWLCGRSWRFEIHFWRNIMRFWKSYICSNKLDV